MLSQSKSEHNLMEALAHGATFPLAKQIPMKVARDFALADIGRKFAPKPEPKGKPR